MVTRGWEVFFWAEASLEVPFWGDLLLGDLETALGTFTSQISALDSSLERLSDLFSSFQLLLMAKQTAKELDGAKDLPKMLDVLVAKLQLLEDTSSGRGTWKRSGSVAVVLYFWFSL